MEEVDSIILLFISHPSYFSTFYNNFFQDKIAWTGLKGTMYALKSKSSNSSSLSTFMEVRQLFYRSVVAISPPALMPYLRLFVAVY